MKRFDLGRAGELGAAVMTNVVATGLVLLVTRSVFYAVATLAAVELLILLWLIRSGGAARKPLGIVRAWRRNGLSQAGPRPKELVTATRREFTFWGISAKSMLSDEDFRRIVVERSHGGCQFRFLFLNPDSAHLNAKANEEGDTPEGWRQEILANMARLRRMRDEEKVDVQVRFYDEYPVFRVFFIDAGAFVGWYPFGSQGVKSALGEVRDREDSLYYPLRLAFENHWKMDRDRLGEGALGLDVE